MANMDYCRFENTLDDLRDCAEHLDNEDLSDAERDARRQLVALCRTIAAEWTERTIARARAARAA